MVVTFCSLTIPFSQKCGKKENGSIKKKKKGGDRNGRTISVLRQKSPPCGISLSLIFYSPFKCNSFLGIKLTLHSKPGCPTFFSYDFWSNFFLLSFVKWVMDPLRKLFQIVNELKRCNVCLIFSICSYPEEQLKQVVFLLLCRSKEKKNFYHQDWKTEFCFV